MSSPTEQEITTELIPLRGHLRLISRDANDPVMLYVNSTSADDSDATTEHVEDSDKKEVISTSLACAHSLYIRHLVMKSGVTSPVINCSALPFHWHTIQATIQFIRSGSLQINTSALHDMMQCALFFRIAELSRVVESFLRKRSTQPETALDTFKTIFHLMTCNELYWLLLHDSRRMRHYPQEYESAAFQRFQIILRWIHFQERQYRMSTESNNQNIQSMFARAIRLFKCVNFQHIRPETRRQIAQYIREVSLTYYVKLMQKCVITIIIIFFFINVMDAPFLPQVMDAPFLPQVINALLGKKLNIYNFIN
ncbi:unnamed protein product [Thelazia callipaeda]|uniref:BTB domain-containing protein n=1 Tax=Thelazia callipaeda TaxID=103827 RepID=A0A0N5CUJ0_THECL|nr:unnamed protein product [Thelazia callipaeda]